MLVCLYMCRCVCTRLCVDVIVLHVVVVVMCVCVLVLTDTHARASPMFDGANVWVCCSLYVSVHAMRVLCCDDAAVLMCICCKCECETPLPSDPHECVCV